MVFIVGRLVYEIGVVILFLVIYARLMTGTRFLQLRFPAELHTVKHKKWAKEFPIFCVASKIYFRLVKQEEKLFCNLYGIQGNYLYKLYTW